MLSKICGLLSVLVSMLYNELRPSLTALKYMLMMW